VNALLDEVRQCIRRHGLFLQDRRILVAVSGGLDSMVLLHLLHELSRKHSWKLTVAHLNHQLRGSSSDADERLVVRTAKRLRLPVVVERAPVRQMARAHKLSVEMAARNARHDFLARTAARLGIRSIALAHHADDQIELFFLRLFRGTSGEGLGGMKWMTPSPSNVAASRSRGRGSRADAGKAGQPLLIRPLLEVSKADLDAFAREHKVPFREDASNARLDIQRNRIRHELLPLLRRNYQPALDRILPRLMDIAAAESECVSRIAAEWLGRRKRVRFETLPPAVQRRCIQLQLFRHHVAAGYELVERLRNAPGRKVMVSPELTVVLAAGGELHACTGPPARNSRPGLFKGEQPLDVELPTKSGRGRIDCGGLKIHWKIDAGKGAIPRKPTPGREVFDADKVGRRILLRRWQAGDRFQPIGMGMAVKLQDVFTNQKIPREQRHELVVLATERGELVWVEKLRISERFKLSKTTNRRLQWIWKRL
jgi:tRNA(Ile)-lysidine synthase